jgi:hypothetical protein
LRKRTPSKPDHIAKLREQPDGGLLDKLVFGAGVGAHVI